MSGGCSICGRSYYLGDHKVCVQRRDADRSRAVEQQHRYWYERTGHCGQCGNPGTYCTCTVRCGCAELHELGSGLRPDALDQFSEAPPVQVGDDQEVLW